MKNMIMLALLVTITSLCYGFSIGLSYEFSGGTAPAGISPWINITFSNISTNTVRVTMSTANLVGTEFVGSWFFNFDPALNPNNLTFSYISGVSVSSIQTGVDAYKADGCGGYFDVKFNFPTSESRFTKQLTSVYDITYTSAITEASFNFGSNQNPSLIGSGSYISAAHIQGIDNGLSGWIGDRNTAPEPRSMILIGLAFLGIWFTKRR